MAQKILLSVSNDLTLVEVESFIKKAREHGAKDDVQFEVDLDYTEGEAQFGLVLPNDAPRVRKTSGGRPKKEGGYHRIYHKPENVEEEKPPAKKVTKKHVAKKKTTAKKPAKTE